MKTQEVFFCCTFSDDLFLKKKHLHGKELFGFSLNIAYAKKSTFRDFMVHVSPETDTKNDRLMKTQEVFSYSLWQNILRKESTFRDFMAHVTPLQTDTQNDRLMKTPEVFSYSLWFYLFIFIFYYFAKGKYFSRFHTFWFTHYHSNENHDLG